MTRTRLPGRTFILAASIILLAGVVINVITSIPMLISSAHWDAVIPIFIPWRYLYIFVLVTSAYTLYMCINGIKFCNIAEKANALFVLGTISTFTAAIILVFNIVALGFNIFLFFGLFLPFLFLIGANKNKNYYDEHGSNLVESPPKEM